MAADEVVYRVSGAGDDRYNGDYPELRLEKEGRTYLFQKGAMNEVWALCCGGLSRVSYISVDGLADPWPPTTGWRPFAGAAVPTPTVERLDLAAEARAAWTVLLAQLARLEPSEDLRRSAPGVWVLLSAEEPGLNQRVLAFL